MANVTSLWGAVHQRFDQTIRLLLARYPQQPAAIYQAARMIGGYRLYQAPPGDNGALAVVVPPDSPFYLVTEQPSGQLSCTCLENRLLFADQSLCSHLLAYLMTVHLELPLLAYKPPAWQSLWQSHILPDLRRQMTRATFNTHFVQTQVAAWQPPNELAIQVGNPRSQDWLGYRLYPIVQRTASLHAGYPLQLKFITSEESMSTTQLDKKQPIHMTVYQDKHHALNFADRLEIGKIGLFVGEYPAGGGRMTRRIAHYMDVDDARWVLRALIAGRDGFQYKEYKGSDKRRNGKGVESRVLSVNISGGQRGDAYVWWDFRAGPGKLTPTGAITPDGEPTCEIKVRMVLNDARRHASAVLAFLQAWDVLRLARHKETVSGFLPYTLAAYGTNLNGEAREDETMSAATAVLPVNGATAQHPLPGSNGGLSSTVATAVAEKVFQGLVYRDKTLVDMGNAVEVATFQGFQAAYKREPKNRAELKQFYENRV